MSQDKQEKPSALSPIAKKLITGGFAGMVEATFNFWLYSIKTRLQDEKIPKAEKITFNPRILYRGFAPFVSAVIPSRATQFGATEAIRTGIKHSYEKDALTDFETLYSACLGGGISGIIAGPNELVIARQTSANGFKATLNFMIKTQGYGILLLGMPGSMFRNAAFNGGTLAGVPIIRTNLKPHLPDSYAQVTAALIAGACAASISQPFDTIKTRQQTDKENMNGKAFSPIWKTAHKIWNQEGLKGFYTGGGARVVRVLFATQIISKTELELKNIMGWEDSNNNSSKPA